MLKRARDLAGRVGSKLKALDPAEVAADRSVAAKIAAPPPPDLGRTFERATKRAPPTAPAAPAVAAPPTYEIRLMGMVQLRIDGVLRYQGPGRRKSDELLAFLALQKGAPVPGERIAAALWPGDDRRDTKGRFHVALHRLRRDLEGAPFDVRTSGHAYSLIVPASCTIDLLLLEEVAGAAQRSVHSGRPVETVGILRRAVELYGGPLLAGCESSWVVSRRENVDRMVAELAKQLADLELAIGNVEGARRATQFAASIRYREAP
jgi:DNA-binding SARP family transcriptional activator